jgi:hypothetical protein
MATIGEPDEERIYVVNAADDPPTSDSSFTDYTNFFIDWKAKGEINKLAKFSGTAIDIDSSTKRGNGLASSAATLAKGNLIYLMSGNTLVSKFVIQKPIFKTDFTVKISGIQNTGTEKLNRKLANESAPARNYKNITFNTILTSTSTTCQGLLVDGSENTILSSTVSSGADDVYSINIDYQNRMAAVDELVNIAGKEWWIDHGTNDSTPYSEGDTLYVDDRKGSAVSTKTFYFEGSNLNARVSEGGDEVETNANHVILEGQDQTNRQIKTEAADFSGMYSCITEGLSLDGWLAEDIDAGDCRIPLTADSFKIMRCCWLDSICCGTIKIDDETIDFCNQVYSEGLPVLRAGSDVVRYPHKKGSDVIWQCSIYQCEEVCLIRPLRIYVDDVDKFCAKDNHLVTIGDEVFRVYNWPHSTGYWEPGADYIVALREWKDTYAHGDKVIVREGGTDWEDVASLDSWSPSNPDNQLNFNTLAGYTVGETITGADSGSTAEVVSGCTDEDYLRVCDISGDFCCGERINGDLTGNMGTLCMAYHTNSIQQNGLYSKTLSSNIPQTKHMLDRKAQGILQTKRLPIKRIAIEVIEPDAVWEEVNLGDTIKLADGADLGFTDNEEVRVTGWEYKFGGAYTSLKLICNDKETRTYSSSMDVNYVDEKITSEQSKQQEPLRTYNKVFSSSECDGSAWSEGLKRLTDVMDPMGDFDAANKQYVDDAGMWCACDSCSSIYPSCTTFCVRPGFLYQNLGSSSCCWRTIYGRTVDTNYLCVNYEVITNLEPGYTWGGGEVGTGYCLGSPINRWARVYSYFVDAPFICTESLYVDGCEVTGGVCWESVVGGIAPRDSWNLYPYSTSDNMGCSGCRWNYIYASNLDLSGDITADYSCNTCLIVSRMFTLPVGNSCY